MKEPAAPRSKAAAAPPANPTSVLYKDLPLTPKLFSRNLSTVSRRNTHSLVFSSFLFSPYIILGGEPYIYFLIQYAELIVDIV